MAIILIVLGVIGGVLAILFGYVVVALGWIFQRKSPEEVGGIRERQERLGRRRIEGRSPSSDTEEVPLVVRAPHCIDEETRTTIVHPSTHTTRETEPRRSGPLDTE